jgi:peroxiredoxin
MTLLRMIMVAAAGAALTIAAPVNAAGGPEVGKVAPDFVGVDSYGKKIKLSDLRGKIVVLEWTNHLCPYTVKHYTTANMQKLQKFAREKGVVWLTIISSAPGTQGHVSPSEANGLTKSRDAAPSNVILDPSGVIGRKYNAKTTPEMFVIKKDGTIAYMGAIDNKPTWRPSSVKEAKNYVKPALEAVLAGKPVLNKATTPYGCSVKYRDGA